MYDLEKVKAEIAASLDDPKRKGPKHWLGAELPYLVYEGLIEYAKEKKITVGQLMLHAFGCYFGLQSSIEVGKQFAQATRVIAKPIKPKASKKARKQQLVDDMGEPPTIEDLSTLSDIK